MSADGREQQKTAWVGERSHTLARTRLDLTEAGTCVIFHAVVEIPLPFHLVGSTRAGAMPHHHGMVVSQCLGINTSSTGRRKERGISGPRPNRTIRSGLRSRTPSHLANCKRSDGTSTG